VKGLDLAEAYYREIGAPMISNLFPEFVDRIATGLVGPGSECFGFDDRLSRDHDWGPAFCMWLSAKDFGAIGRSLQAAYEKLPQSFQGYPPRVSSPGEEARTGVTRITSFYRAYTGQDHIPQTNMQWLSISENALSASTNGRVFHDALDEFSRWRRALQNFYPRDVQLKKIASRCITIGQYGQYNLERCLKRGEHVAGNYAITQFCKDTISLIFLLNRRYTPFYKWMHRAVGQLPVLGSETHRIVGDLVSGHTDQDKRALIEELCALIVQELRRQDLTDSHSTFLLDHAQQVHLRIEDTELGAGLFVVD